MPALAEAIGNETALQCRSVTWPVILPMRGSASGTFGSVVGYPDNGGRNNHCLRRQWCLRVAFGGGVNGTSQSPVGVGERRALSLSLDPIYLGRSPFWPYSILSS